MNARDPAASLDAEASDCRWCGDQFWHGPARNPPRYCSDDCRRMAHAERERERRRTLTDHGLCPHCKRPR